MRDKLLEVFSRFLNLAREDYRRNELRVAEKSHEAHEWSAESNTTPAAGNTP
jgi:hypothetical protein